MHAHAAVLAAEPQQQQHQHPVSGGGSFGISASHKFEYPRPTSPHHQQRAQFKHGYSVDYSTHKTIQQQHIDNYGKMLYGKADETRKLSTNGILDTATNAPAPITNSDMSALNGWTQAEAESGHTTSQNDSEDAPSMAEEIHAIKGNLLFLNHQIMRLMKSLNVKQCECVCCESTSGHPMPQNDRKRSHQSGEEDMRGGANMTKQMRLEPKETTNDTVAITSNDNTNGNDNGVQVLEEDGKRSTSPSTSTNGSEEPDEEAPERDENASPQSTTAHDWLEAVKPNGATVAATPIENASCLAMPRRGRKSKYCSASEKRAVAGYAQTHGATAAARKFNIPPAVAAYYHRKQFKSPRSVGAELTIVVTEEAAFFPENFNGAEYAERMRSGHGEDPAGASRTPSTAPPISACPRNIPTSGNSVGGTAQASGHSSPFSDGPASAVLLEANNNSNNNNNGEFDANECGAWSSALDKSATHSGSPGFLRGRGRGRPKLIGDELDAELVEYMVQLKAVNRQHLTASQALQIARSYIAEKSPGLLEEHGGQIKLKITWAMKLVSRISEREREIQLGLPAGSLQNLGRNSSASKHSTEDFISQQALLNQQNINGAKNDASYQSSPRQRVAANAASTAQWSGNAKAVGGDLTNGGAATMTQQQQQSTVTSLLSALSKFSAEQLSGAAALSNGGANNELFDLNAVIAELGINSLDELAQCEPFKSLLQASMVSTNTSGTAPVELNTSASKTTELLNATNALSSSDTAQPPPQSSTAQAVQNGSSTQNAEMLVTSAF